MTSAGIHIHLDRNVAASIMMKASCFMRTRVFDHVHEEALNRFIAGEYREP